MCYRSKGSPFQVVGPATEKERFCIVAEQSNGTTKSPCAEDRSVLFRTRGQILWYRINEDLANHVDKQVGTYVEPCDLRHRSASEGNFDSKLLFNWNCNFT